MLSVNRIDVAHPTKLLSCREINLPGRVCDLVKASGSVCLRVNALMLVKI